MSILFKALESLSENNSHNTKDKKKKRNVSKEADKNVPKRKKSKTHNDEAADEKSLTNEVQDHSGKGSLSDMPQGSKYLYQNMSSII